MDCNGFGVCGGFPDLCDICVRSEVCRCSEKKCPNLMWVEEYNKVMLWMVEHNLWEEYKMEKPKPDYSEWTIWEIIDELKRLADEIKKPTPREG